MKKCKGCWVCYGKGRPISMITPNVQCTPEIKRSTSSYIRRRFRKRRRSKIGRSAKLVKMVEVEVDSEVHPTLEKLRNLFCKQGDKSKNSRSNRCNMVIRGPRVYLSRTGLNKSTLREAPIVRQSTEGNPLPTAPRQCPSMLVSCVLAKGFSRRPTAAMTYGRLHDSRSTCLASYLQNNTGRQDYSA